MGASDDATCLKEHPADAHSRWRHSDRMPVRDTALARAKLKTRCRFEHRSAHSAFRRAAEGLSTLLMADTAQVCRERVMTNLKNLASYVRVDMADDIGSYPHISEATLTAMAAQGEVDWCLTPDTPNVHTRTMDKFKRKLTINGAQDHRGHRTCGACAKEIIFKSPLYHARTVAEPPTRAPFRQVARSSSLAHGRRDEPSLDDEPLHCDESHLLTAVGHASVAARCRARARCDANH